MGKGGCVDVCLLGTAKLSSLIRKPDTSALVVLVSFSPSFVPTVIVLTSDVKVHGLKPH